MAILKRIKKRKERRVKRFVLKQRRLELHRLLINNQIDNKMAILKRIKARKERRVKRFNLKQRLLELYRLLINNQIGNLINAFSVIILFISNSVTNVLF